MSLNNPDGEHWLPERVARRRRALILTHITSPSPHLLSSIALSIAIFAQHPANADTSPAAPWIEKTKQCLYEGDDTKALEYATKAVQADPNNVDAHLIRGDCQVPYLLGYQAAREDYAAALKLDPENYHALTFTAICLQNSNMEVAKQYHQRALDILKKLPATADTVRHQAISTFWTNNKTAVLPISKVWTEKSPESPEAWYMLSNAYEALGKKPESKQAALHCLSLLKADLKNHLDGNIGRLIARASRNAGSETEGINLLSDYIATHPDSIHALYWRGLMRIQDGHLEPGLADLKKSVDLAPQYFSHLSNYAEYLMQSGHLREAERIYVRLVELDPDSEVIREKRINCLRELGMNNVALQEVDKLLARRSSDYKLWRLKFEIKNKQDPDSAKKDLKMALTLATAKIEAGQGFVQTYIDRANMYISYGQPAKAIPDISEAIRLRPDDAALYHLRATVNWVNLDARKEAIADETKAIELSPLNARCCYLNTRGSYYKSMERYDEAIADANKSIALEPENGFGYRLRAIILAQRGNYAAALDDLSTASRTRTVLPDTDGLFARIYAALGKTKEAATAFDTALTKHPKDIEALVGRASVYLKTDKVDLAMRDFNKAVEVSPDNGELYFARARGYGAKGEYLKAAADLTEGMELNKMNNAPWILEDRARYYTYAEHYKEAAADLARAYKYNWNKPILLYQCGKLLYQSGNKAAAIVSISEYLKRVPDVKALQARARCYLETGQYTNAITDYTNLIRANPENPRFFTQRAKAYSALGNDSQATADRATSKSLSKSH